MFFKLEKKQKKRKIRLNGGLVNLRLSYFDDWDWPPKSKIHKTPSPPAATAPSPRRLGPELPALRRSRVAVERVVRRHGAAPGAGSMVSGDIWGWMGMGNFSWFLQKMLVDLGERNTGWLTAIICHNDNFEKNIGIFEWGKWSATIRIWG